MTGHNRSIMRVRYPNMSTLRNSHISKADIHHAGLHKATEIKSPNTCHYHMGVQQSHYQRACAPGILAAMTMPLRICHLLDIKFLQWWWFAVIKDRIGAKEEGPCGREGEHQWMGGVIEVDLLYKCAAQQRDLILQSADEHSFTGPGELPESNSTPCLALSAPVFLPLQAFQGQEKQAQAAEDMDCCCRFICPTPPLPLATIFWGPNGRGLGFKADRLVMKVMPLQRAS